VKRIFTPYTIIEKYPISKVRIFGDLHISLIFSLKIGKKNKTYEKRKTFLKTRGSFPFRRSKAPTPWSFGGETSQEQCLSNSLWYWV